MEKRMEVSPVLERHITRIDVCYVHGTREEKVWVPDNAAPDRSNLNRELILREVKTSEGQIRTQTINQAINSRIKEAGINKVRRNQNKAIEVILSGSPATLNALSYDDVVKWANESLEWAREQWGKDNVVSAVLHCDEKTPHIHLILVPIVKGQSRRTKSKAKKLAQQGIEKKKYNINNERSRLAANEVYTKPRLYAYHTSYAERVGLKYGLKRGLIATQGSRKNHTESIDYNRELARQVAEQQALVTELTSEYNDKKSNIQASIDSIAAEKERIIKEATDEALKVQQLQKMSATLYSEIRNRETRINELDESINEKNREDEEGLSLKEALEKYNDELQTENEELNELIEARKVELQSLSSMGLMKMIQSIPDLIKQDVQSLVNACWRGNVLNFYEKKMNVDGIEQDIVEIHLRNGDREYFIEINEKDGLVWYNGAEKPVIRKKSGRVMYMPEIARYFREKISGEAKELVNSLYKKPEVNVIWNCRLDYDNCRIIKHPDGKLELQKRELSKEYGDRSMIWTRKKVFRSFKEMGGDKNNIFLKLTHSDGATEYVNQYGEKINNQQLRSVGISVNQRGVHF